MPKFGDDLQFLWPSADYDLKQIILDKLNLGESITDTLYDARKVRNGFVSSKACMLHDGPRKKTIFIAFHIPNQNEAGKIHHYDVSLFRFAKSSATDKWESEIVEKLTDKEVSKLYICLEEQNQFIGYTPDRRYFKILSSGNPATLEDMNFVVDSLLKDPSIEHSKGSDVNNLVVLLTKLLKGNSVLINQELYNELLNYRTNSISILRYETDLADFRKLIDSPTAKETDLQNFLESRIWLFGLNYNQSHRQSIPRFNSPLGSKYDFLLEGFNQVYDIAELKGPNEPLFEKDSSSGLADHSFNERVDYRYSTRFARALHQITKYMNEFETSFGHIQSNQPDIQPFLYPHGIIVMSKRALFPINGGDSAKYLHLLNRQFSNIDILTYDDLYDRGKIILDFIKLIPEDYSF